MAKHDLEQCVKRLKVQPDDVIVIRFPRPITAEEREDIGRVMQALWPKNQALILPDGVAIEVVEQSKSAR